MNPLLRLALRPWKLAPVSQTLSVLTVGFLLFLGGFLHWLADSLQPFISRMQNNQVITAYLHQDVSDRGESEIVDAIKLHLGAAPERQRGKESMPEITVVDTHEFLGQLSMTHPKLRNQLVDMGSDVTYLVPRHVTISGAVMTGDLEKIQSVAGVDSAESSQSRFKHVVGAFQSLQWVARILAIGLALALFSGLVHLAKMNAWLNADLLGWMKLMGADALYLRVPPALNGLLIGLAGGSLAYMSWMLLSVSLAEKVAKFSPVPDAFPLPVIHLAFWLLLWGAVAGLVSGLMGGVVAHVHGQNRQH